MLAVTRRATWRASQPSLRCSRSVLYPPTRAYKPTINNPEASLNWIEKSPLIPITIKPYLLLARLDKPVGIWLLLWPCVWSTSLAAPHVLPDPLLLLQFAVGATIMRGAGCTVNDILDQKYDRDVERTKNRPLASGAVSTSGAVQFLALQLSMGLCTLLTFNSDTVLLASMSLPLVFAYPLMKRFFAYPQLVLGLTYNWGALLGSVSVKGGFLLSDFLCMSLPLYLSGVCWTLVYDTIYAYQDVEDDRRLGLKSTALALGDDPRLPLSCMSVAMVSLLALAGKGAGLGPTFYLGSSVVGAHLLWQVHTASYTGGSDRRENLWIRFAANKYTGAVVALSIVTGNVFY